MLVLIEWIFIIVGFLYVVHLVIDVSVQSILFCVKETYIYIFLYIYILLFCTITNKCKIISQIITLLHISTLSCHPPGACNQYLAKLTHCGRVTQICVFNTLKLGTFASSP